MFYTHPPDQLRIPLALEDARREVGRAAVALVLDGAVVVNRELVGSDPVAQGDVATGVERVPDLEVKTTVRDLVDGPSVGDVVGAGAVLDLGQVVGALDESLAVASGQRGVADDLKAVAVSGVSSGSRMMLGTRVFLGLPAHHGVRDAAGNEVGDRVLGSLLLLKRGA